MQTGCGFTTVMATELLLTKGITLDQGGHPNFLFFVNPSGGKIPGRFTKTVNPLWNIDSSISVGWLLL